MKHSTDIVYEDTEGGRGGGRRKGEREREKKRDSSIYLLKCCRHTHTHTRTRTHARTQSLGRREEGVGGGVINPRDDPQLIHLFMHCTIYLHANAHAHNYTLWWSVGNHYPRDAVNGVFTMSVYVTLSVSPL